jgi:OCT family organic cation transporter-like MFS transporter 4/5
VTGFVLAMEMMGPSKRVFAGIVIEYFFAIGQVILVAFAYTNNILFESGWRTLAIALVVPTMPFLSYFFLLPESPRWLLSKNRQDEAFEILQGVAKTNKRTLDKETWNALLEQSNQKSNQSENKSENILDLIKSLHLGIMCAILFFQWIINNFIFYGVGLKSNDLGVNPYLSFLISAAVEILAYIVSHAILDRLGRKLPYVVSLAFAGFSCFSIGFVSDTNIVVVLAMSGKFFASMSYAIIYLYSSELFPTSIRNTGMGCCSMMARIGSMTAPLMIGLGDTLNMPNLPFLAFGITGLIGCGCALMLPETLNKKLPDTIQEAERINKFTLSCKAYVDDDDLNGADETELKSLKS